MFHYRPTDSQTPYLLFTSHCLFIMFGCCRALSRPIDLDGGAENARLENAELENPAPNHRSGKRGTGKRGNLKVMESHRCRKCAT